MITWTCPTCGETLQAIAWLTLSVAVEGEDPIIQHRRTCKGAH